MRNRFGAFLMASAATCAALPAAAAPSAPSGVVVLERTADGALLEWSPADGTPRGYKIRSSPTPGVHPDPVLYPGGKLAAFTWTTDDGYDDNLLYEPVFSSRGLHFTAFVNPAHLGMAGRMTWADLDALHAAGHEVANHTMTHTALIDDRAIALRYTGAEPCSLAIAGGRLRTWVAGVPDLDVLLTAPGTSYLATLAAALDADPDYEAVRLAAPDTIYATYAQFLDPVSGRQIGAGAPAETLTTARGVHDDAEMLAEIEDARIALEDHLRIADPSYRCRTLAYPNHAHAQWAVSTLAELGYLGARAGPVGPWPYYSQGSYRMGFQTSFEVPHGIPRSSNAWTEAQTRTTFLNRMAVWKANREWTVLMAHHEGEVDVAHLEWSIDTVASDPAIWIARFDEVMDFLRAYFVDVGNPLDPGTGKCRAWLRGLDPAQSLWVVVTAYDAALGESGWSTEVLVPAYGATTDAPLAVAAPFATRAFPNPFRQATTIEFLGGRAGSTRVRIFDAAGRRVDERDLGPLAAGPQRFVWDGRTADRTVVPAGVYWYRVEDDDSSVTGRLNVLR